MLNAFLLMVAGVEDGLPVGVGACQPDHSCAKGIRVPFEAIHHVRLELKDSFLNFEELPDFGIGGERNVVAEERVQERVRLELAGRDCPVIPGKGFFTGCDIL